MSRCRWWQPTRHCWSRLKIQSNQMKSKTVIKNSIHFRVDLQSSFRIPVVSYILHLISIDRGQYLHVGRYDCIGINRWEVLNYQHWSLRDKRRCYWRIWETRRHQTRNDRPFRAKVLLEGVDCRRPFDPSQISKFSKRCSRWPRCGSDGNTYEQNLISHFTFSIYFFVFH